MRLYGRGSIWSGEVRRLFEEDAKPTCPHCGGKLLSTANPFKLICEYCGRVVKNYSYIERFRKKSPVV